ncbi:MAG: DUF177 domain-containing protein [Clostridia bacterium]|nr:DUF177 domain-containing protein [Clostridia bacterium]
MKLDLRPLLSGERLLNIDYELPLDIDPDDTSGFLYGTSFPSPMKVKGDITNTAGYMRMVIHATVDYVAQCGRCLAPVTGSFSLDLEKTVAPRNLLGELTEDKLDDFAIIEDGFLDMDEQLREQLEMEFPVRFLCREDCKGLCPKCGQNLNEGTCSCSLKEPDPRLAPLAKILEDMKKNNNK